jgi:starch-binding outer membrane protein, SusD/RagB family
MKFKYYQYRQKKTQTTGMSVTQFYWFFCFIFLVELFAGCKKFVLVDPPVTQLVTASVFSNNGTATSAQTGIYQLMIGESFARSLETGLMGDELTSYGVDMNFYTNSLIASNNAGPWGNAYSYIYQANAIIEGLQNNSSISLAIKQQLTGESIFVRAFWHFYLANLYGDVPVVTSTNYATNSVLPRSPKSEVYRQIITDLTNAQSLLNSNFVDASDTTITSDRVRPTKWAAAALLARAYLYTGNNWDSAEAQSTLVIQNASLFSLVPILDSVFLANSSEAIWQLALPLPSRTNATPDGNSYIMIAGPYVGYTPISTQLWNSFETGDERKTNWVGTFTDTTTTPFTNYYFPNKYKVRVSDAVSEYVMVLRLAEQYLIRAEARAEQGNLLGAANDLNVIRNRAGLPNTTAVTQVDLLTAILHERQVELFTEWGHRWFDLIRTGNANSIMSVVTPLKGGLWSNDGHKLLYPIPQSEIQANHNLTQNPGY